MAPPPLPLPLDPLVATWVELLAQSIKRRHQDGYQGVLAYVVKVAPLLCKEARDLWRAETRAPYLLTFCNYLYGSGYRTRYLDALPLQLMAAPPPVVVDDRPLPAPELFEMHEERRKLAEQLATMVWDDATDESDRQCLYPAPGLPTVVRCFTGHIEDKHHRYTRHASYARVFCTCQRVGCVRPALLQVPETDPDESSDAEYWSCCRDGSAPAPDARLPSDMCFCSHGCFAATNSEFQRIVSFKIETLVCPTRHGGAMTPSRLYRAALSRNAALERALLRAGAQPTVHYPSTMADHERLQRDRITMLSVDAGLLYAAECLYQAPARLKPRRPLPRTEGWRKKASCFLRAVENVRKLYLQYGGGRITKTGNERWLRFVKSQTLKIFTPS